jgi:hypothetical protein
LLAQELSALKNSAMGPISGATQAVASVVSSAEALLVELGFSMAAHAPHLHPRESGLPAVLKNDTVPSADTALLSMPGRLLGSVREDSEVSLQRLLL